MSRPTAITLVRTHPWPYQVTYWDDGTARWDSTTGPRSGAWQASVPRQWFARVSRSARRITPAVTLKGGVTVVVDSSDGSCIATSAEGCEPEPLWLAATLIDGMVNRTNWGPLDVLGEIDMSPWVNGVPVLLSQRTLTARALATGEGLILLAGSQLATSTAPSLQTNYAAQRSQLQDDGDVTLDDDCFTLTRHLHFPSPSAAASVVSGSNTNGRHAWRTATGAPLSNLTRI